MHHGDLKTGLFGQLGQFDLPELDPVAVGPAGVGSDQELGGGRETRPTHRGPPASDGLDGEGGGVGRVADRDPALVVGQVVDPIGDGSTQFLVDEVMGLGPSRLAGWVPFGSSIGEFAHDLLFLGIDADHRLARLYETAHLFVR